MSPAIEEAIGRVSEAEWFHSVGKPIDHLDILRAHSWKEAGQYYSSPSWEEFAIEAVNELKAIGYRLRPNRSVPEWNRIIAQIKRKIEPLVRNRVVQLIREQMVPEAIENCVKWDLLAYCRASEFRDEAPESLYLKIGEWYMAGHFPCGWIGDYPKGKLVVF
jgi:hypothetical protein